jgi:NitT/TauT family transport system substrate-binding protein
MKFQIIKPVLLLLLTWMTVMLTGCALNIPGSSQPTKELTVIRLPMGYIPNVQYAPFYMASAKGYYYEAGFEVVFDYSFETDGVALVGANELQFSLVSGEQVLLARAQGLPVVYVMSWWQDYPVAVAALESSGIRTVQDLRGKKIGLPGLFGANYIGLRALLSSQGMDEQDVTLDSIGFNQVEALIAGREDAVVIYANNEPNKLIQQGYSVNVIRVADYVHLASNGLLTNETTIANNPELVQRFIDATLKGLADTLADPEAAYEICKKFVEGLDQNEELQKIVLEASMEFWRTERPGWIDPLAWENMQNVLLEMGLLSRPLDLNQAFSNQFIK